ARRQQEKGRRPEPVADTAARNPIERSVNAAGARPDSMGGENREEALRSARSGLRRADDPVGFLEAERAIAQRIVVVTLPRGFPFEGSIAAEPVALLAVAAVDRLLRVRAPRELELRTRSVALERRDRDPSFGARGGRDCRHVCHPG